MMSALAVHFVSFGVFVILWLKSNRIKLYN